MPVTAIILAAGLSTRFRANKLLHEIDGRALILRTLEAINACGFEDVIAVTGHQAEAVEAVLKTADRPPRIARNPDYANGMGASISAGVRAATVRNTGYLIVPGDMPYLSPATLIALADGSDLNRLAACRGAEGPEAPAFFGHSYRQQLQALKGDRGARQILDAHREKLHLIVAERQELVDIDERV